jgi:glycosyltransferase involved in cell wall biosynthesis
MCSDNFVFLLPDFLGGGAEKNSVIFANKLSDLGYSVTICCVSQNGPNFININDGISVINFGLSSSKYKWLLLPIIFLYFLAKIPKNSIIFGSIFYTNIHLYFLSYWGHKIFPYETTIRSYADKNFFKIRRFFVKSYIFRSKSTVCVSRSVINDLVENYGIPPDKLSLLYNPSFIANKSFLYSSLPFSFSIVGRIIPSKMIEIAILSFSQVVSQASIPVILNIYGEGSPLYVNSLKLLVDKLSISENVLFHGYIDNLDFIYKNTSCLLVTSLYEGFGNIIIEANSFGIPCIVNKSSGGSAEITLDNLTGFLSDENNYSTDMLKIIDYKFNHSFIINYASNFSISNTAKNLIGIVSKYVK